MRHERRERTPRTAARTPRRRRQFERHVVPRPCLTEREGTPACAAQRAQCGMRSGIPARWGMPACRFPCHEERWLQPPKKYIPAAPPAAKRGQAALSSEYGSPRCAPGA